MDETTRITPHIDIFGDLQLPNFEQMCPYTDEGIEYPSHVALASLQQFNSTFGFPWKLE